jgi:hypothetical protein
MIQRSFPSHDRAVQYKNIPELNTIDLDAYRAPKVITWKLVKKVELL